MLFWLPLESANQGPKYWMPESVSSTTTAVDIVAGIARYQRQRRPRAGLSWRRWDQLRPKEGRCWRHWKTDYYQLIISSSLRPSDAPLSGNVCRVNCKCHERKRKASMYANLVSTPETGLESNANFCLREYPLNKFNSIHWNQIEQNISIPDMAQFSRSLPFSRLFCGHFKATCYRKEIY